MFKRVTAAKIKSFHKALVYVTRVERLEKNLSCFQLFIPPPTMNYLDKYSSPKGIHSLGMPTMVDLFKSSHEKIPLEDSTTFKIQLSSFGGVRMLGRSR